MEELLLGFEDLEAAEQARVLRFLEEHPRQAARLENFRALEGLALGELPVAESAWEDGNLTAEESRQQQESLNRILAALADQGLAETARHQGPMDENQRHRRISHSKLSSRLTWALPLAAVLAMAIILPRWPGGGDSPNSPRVVVLVGEEGTRGAGSHADTRGILHTGQAFALDFFLDRDSHVLVYHLDPAGRLALVWPAQPGPGPSYLGGDQQHRVPRAESDEVWVLGPETGIESFLVASFGQWTDACLSLEATSGLTQRAEILADLTLRLEKIRARVEIIEFEHRD